MRWLLVCCLVCCLLRSVLDTLLCANYSRSHLQTVSALCCKLCLTVGSYALWCRPFSARPGSHAVNWQAIIDTAELPQPCCTPAAFAVASCSMLTGIGEASWQPTTSCTRSLCKAMWLLQPTFPRLSVSPSGSAWALRAVQHWVGGKDTCHCGCLPGFATNMPHALLMCCCIDPHSGKHSRIWSQQA
jgi:hypothetical protein